MGILLCCFREKEDTHNSDNRSSLNRTHKKAVPHPHTSNSAPDHNPQLNSETPTTRQIDANSASGSSLDHRKKAKLEKLQAEHGFVVQSSDGVCATCLEEYDDENPKIILQCSHSFHLSCIYEWMERSPFCPFCGKVMLFL